MKRITVGETTEHVLEEILELEQEADACRKLMLEVDKAGAVDLKKCAESLEATARELRQQLQSDNPMRLRGLQKRKESLGTFSHRTLALSTAGRGLLPRTMQ